ncbi:protein of unknown function [Hyphomicrobium sp. MC1]|nr:protein of unknown function [Hyphomicrobium sp. MC1]
MHLCPLIYNQQYVDKSALQSTAYRMRSLARVIRSGAKSYVCNHWNYRASRRRDGASTA